MSQEKFPFCLDACPHCLLDHLHHNRYHDHPREKERERETDQGATTTEGVTQLPPRTHFLFCPKIYSDDLTVTGLCRVVWWWQTWLLSHLTPHWFLLLQKSSLMTSHVEREAVLQYFALTVVDVYHPAWCALIPCFTQPLTSLLIGWSTRLNILLGHSAPLLFTHKNILCDSLLRRLKNWIE